MHTLSYMFQSCDSNLNHASLTPPAKTSSRLYPPGRARERWILTERTKRNAFKGRIVAKVETGGSATTHLLKALRDDLDVAVAHGIAAFGDDGGISSRSTTGCCSTEATPTELSSAAAAAMLMLAAAAGRRKGRHGRS